MDTDPAPPGIRFLDHTADVGFDLHAPTLEALFLRAATGLAWLLQGADATHRRDGAEPVHVSLEVSADDVPSLLRSWLRELLHRHETAGLTFRTARFELLMETRLEALVTLVEETTDPIREIKGVTLHGLRAEQSDGGWIARVIFDV